MKRLYLLCTFMLAACAAQPARMLLPDPPDAQAATEKQGPYSVYSQDVGWDEIDLRITEVETSGQVSTFHVPYYNTRTPTESNFAICAFAQFAILSGYSHFTVAETEVDRHHVEVGFFVGVMQEPAELFEERFHRDDYPIAFRFGKYCEFFDAGSGETRSEFRSAAKQAG